MLFCIPHRPFQHLNVALQQLDLSNHFEAQLLKKLQCNAYSIVALYFSLFSFVCVWFLARECYSALSGW
jgi:hypothetical protein